MSRETGYEYCATVRHGAPRCAALRHGAPRCAALRHGAPRCAALRRVAQKEILVTTLLTKPIYYFLLRLAVVHVLVDVELLLQIVHENHLDEGLLALLMQPLVALGEPLLVESLVLGVRVVSVYLLGERLVCVCPLGVGNRLPLAVDQAAARQRRPARGAPVRVLGRDLGLGVQHLADHVAHLSVFHAVTQPALHDGGHLLRHGVAERGRHAAEKPAPRGVVVRLEAHRERLVGGGERERGHWLRLNGYWHDCTLN